MVHIDIGEGLKLPFPSAGKVGALFSPLKGASFLPLPISFSLLPPQPLPLGPVAGQATVKALRGLLLPPGWECTWSALWTLLHLPLYFSSSTPYPQASVDGTGATLPDNQPWCALHILQRCFPPNPKTTALERWKWQELGFHRTHHTCCNNAKFSVNPR